MSQKTKASERESSFQMADINQTIFLCQNHTHCVSLLNPNPSYTLFYTSFSDASVGRLDTQSKWRDGEKPFNSPTYVPTLPLTHISIYSYCLHDYLHTCLLTCVMGILNIKPKFPVSQPKLFVENKASLE